MPTIYTIGHSTHSQSWFLELLVRHAITAVGDVRSLPRSRVNPQFDREQISRVLRQNAIAYVFLGDELGARTKDGSCYVDGRVQYDRLARTASFQDGIKRLKTGVQKGFRIALMCAEKEPLDCHRTILISRYLVLDGFDIQHILADGSLEAHTASIYRLREKLGLVDDHMFRSVDNNEEDAYRLQEDRIAYRLPSFETKRDGDAREL